MQTFVPYPSCTLSAHALDNKRLGKQRVEAFQILCVLGDTEALKLRAELKGVPVEWLPRYKGWLNHPATLMWRGYRMSLRVYYNAMCAEFNLRFGGQRPYALRPLYVPNYRDHGARWWEMPPWWGDDAIHGSHRAMLLAKDPKWYGQFDWDEAPGGGYVWADALTYRKTATIAPAFLLGGK